MEQLALALGREEEAQGFGDRGRELEEAIQRTFWDEEAGFYFDRSEITGQLNRLRTVAGLLPLWLGTVPAERASRLVEEHLLNPEEFWLNYPVATWAKNEKGYYQERKGGECTWMGATWIPTNYMVFHGLKNQGFSQAAHQLAVRTLEMVLAESTTREYYNGETGAGQGLSPFWGWSSLGYVMALEDALEYDPTQLCRSGDMVTLTDLEPERSGL